jgi:hypothetical protein
MIQPRLIQSDERIVDAMIELACATRLHRMIVAGPHSPEVLLELHRRGYFRVTSAKLCDVPCGQFDVALVAWREHSIKGLETTLDGLVHFLSAVGVLVVWVGVCDRVPIQMLRVAIDRLGFRIDAGSTCENGVTISAGRLESKSIAMSRDTLTTASSGDTFQDYCLRRPGQLLRAPSSASPRQTGRRRQIKCR